MTAGLPRAPVPKVRHKTEGSLWEASWPISLEEGHLYASLFDENAPRFWFRELTENPRRRWWTPWRPRFIRTGRLWKGRHVDDFDLLPAALKL